MEHLKEFCTDRQLEIVEAVIKYPNKQLAANALGVSRSTVRNAIKGVEKKAAANGVAPNRDVNHRTMEGFNTKFVTSRFDGDGNLQGQYVRQEREKFDLEAMLEGALLTRQLIAEVRESAKISVEPISDVRASAAYRRDMTANLITRGLEAALGLEQPNVYQVQMHA